MQLDHPPHLSPFQRLFSLLAHERRELIIVVIYAMAIGVFSLAIPFTAMIVVNTTAMGTLVQQLIVVCLVLFVSLFLAMILRTSQMIVVEYIQRRIFVRVVADLSYRLPHVDVKAFDRQHGPELVNRFFDVLTVQKASATLLLDGMAVALQMGIGLLLLAFYHPFLLGFDLILIAALTFVVFVLGRNGPATSIAESLSKYRVAGWMEELARHPEVFKLNGAVRFAQARADELTKGYLETRRRHFRVVLRQFVFGLAIQTVASTALLGLGGWLVVQGQLSLGQLVAAEIVVTLVVSSFTKFGKQLESYYDLLAAVDKLGHLMDLPLERQTGVEHPPSPQGIEVRLEGIGFAYDQAHGSVLNEFTAHIRPGERVAIMGNHGAGKSTLLDILYGLRNPDRGYIEIDGLDLRDIKLESVREQIAMVKGIEVFDGTVLENVRMGRETITTGEIREALKMVGLLGDVSDFPEGLEMPLVAGGAPLSLGQAQRVMLARAILGKPRLLILDETFDYMSPTLRRQVIAAVLDRSRPWTVLVVTHKPDVADACDRVVQLVRGNRLPIAETVP